MIQSIFSIIMALNYLIMLINRMTQHVNIVKLLNDKLSYDVL